MNCARASAASSSPPCLIFPKAPVVLGTGKPTDTALAKGLAMGGNLQGAVIDVLAQHGVSTVLGVLVLN